MKLKVSEAISKALLTEMTENKRIFIIGEEVGKSNGTYKATENLYKKFGPDRVVDTPISEMGFTGLAVGASYCNLIPVCEFMTWNFALQSIDHIINSSAKMRYMTGGLIGSSIVFRGPNGFSTGVGAQHTQDFAAWYGSVPGLKVIAPYSAKDHYGTLKMALRDGNPVVILENEELYKQEFDYNFDDSYLQEFKCVIEKEGNDITIIGISINLNECHKAIIELNNKFSIELINLLSIRPLDIDTIYKSVEKTKKLLIVDNCWPNFSVASEIYCQVHEKFGEKVKVKRLNGKDCPTAYAENLEKMSFPSKDEIVNLVNEMLQNN